MKITSRPKVLVFIDWFVPGYKAGGPIRSCLNAMHHLKEEIDFYVLCTDRDYLETEPYQNIHYGQWNNVDENISVRYLKKEEINKETYANIIDSMPFDAIHINGIYSKDFSILPLRVARKKNIPVVVSVRGMLKDSAIAIKKFKKETFIKIAKLGGLYKNVVFHATNEEEANDVKRRIGLKSKIKIAPNLTKKIDLSAERVVDKESKKLRLVWVARISPEKNLKYAISILKSIPEEYQITFDLFGAKYNMDYWDECQREISELGKNVKVTYKGLVHPNDMDITLQKYHLLLLPTRGENFGHVIIECLNNGVPVLISDQTPWRDLENANVGYDLSLNDKSQYASVIRMMADMGRKEYLEMHKSCLIFARNHIADHQAIALNKKLFISND